MESNYNFKLAYEPSEKQLMLIMKEVAEEAKHKATMAEKKFNEYLRLLIIDTISQFDVKYGEEKYN